MFICLEGIDGSGKSAQAKLLEEYLIDKGKDVLRTEFPTNNVIGSILRRIIKKQLYLESKEAVCMMFVADMYEDYKLIITPAINSGKIVICDRYFESNMAYQGAEGIDKVWIRHLQKYIVAPTISFFLDVPIDVAYSRLEKVKDKYEKQEFLKKVRNFYLSELFENRVVIKGDMNIKQTHDSIVDHLKGKGLI